MVDTLQWRQLGFEARRSRDANRTVMLSINRQNVVPYRADVCGDVNCADSFPGSLLGLARQPGRRKGRVLIFISPNDREDAAQNAPNYIIAASTSIINSNSAELLRTILWSHFAVFRLIRPSVIRPRAECFLLKTTRSLFY